VGRAKAVQALEEARRGGSPGAELAALYGRIKTIPACRNADPAQACVGSAVYANKPGDGSAREQAASCQRVLGGRANFAQEYATKRYRSNLINWGLLPFLVQDPSALKTGGWVFVPGIRKALLEDDGAVTGYALDGSTDSVVEIALSLGPLSDAERQILADGCLINYYRR
jgi:aconitate hydratase